MSITTGNSTPTPNNARRGHSQQKLRALTVAEKLGLQSIRTASVPVASSSTDGGFKRL